MEYKFFLFETLFEASNLLVTNSVEKMKTRDMMKTIMDRAIRSQTGALPKHIGMKNTTMQNAVVYSPVIAEAIERMIANKTNVKPTSTSRRPILDNFI